MAFSPDRRRRLGLLTGLLFWAAVYAGTQSGALHHGVRSVTVEAEPISAFEIGRPSRQRFGALEFRGGLVLTSEDRGFGGLSALLIREDGASFVACSDRASWLVGRIVYQDGWPSGIAEASLAPVLDAEGRPASWDTEAVAEAEGRLYLGLERRPGVMCFDFGDQGVLARGRPVPVPPELEDLPSNRGLEALVSVPKGCRLGGTLVGFAEVGLTDAGNFKAFLIGGPTPGLFAVKRTGEYGISDAAMLPGGDLLILERAFSLERGVAIRIRRLPLGEIEPDALVDGPVLFEADLRCAIDNMEALGVHVTESGETRLTLLSDDNFSPIQRTLLLQFALVEK
ncbi:MAG TPA: twin-arginine translocation pathway signal [Candidatus Aminicenantes bacterium]|nr:twin-arginine translocation pathway signal [Candidatus Aminicenantes bacterium]